MICPKCQKWEVRDDDLFCSWCRLKLSDFELSLDTPQLYVGDPILDGLTLTIKHTGSVGQVEIKQLVANQPWLKLRTDEIANLSLRSGGVITVPVEVDPMEMVDDYHEAVIEAQSNIGPRSTRLDVVPRPEIHVFTGEYTILLDMLQDEKNSGYLEVTRGVVTVKSLSTDVPWAKVELCDGVKYPVRVDGRLNSRLDFRFVFDEDRLISDIDTSRRQPPVEYQGNLVIEYREFSLERRESFRVKCYLPPALIIPEETGQTVRVDAFLGKRKELDITLQNGDRDVNGRAELKVFDLTIDQQWLRPATPITFPLVIPSGWYHQIGFVIDGAEISDGLHVARLSFLTNLPAPNNQPDLFVDLNVLRMEEFGGTLAIDFGTTNSCCAYIDEFGRSGLIEIDPDSKPKPTTAPSAILYQDSPDGQTREFEVGRRAYEFSFHPEAQPSTVTQVKRKVGRSELIAITYFRDTAKRVSLLPKDVASDIVGRILERAEEALKSKITRCTISHPSRFSLRQINDLKAALTSRGINEITTIHEPVGAALSFIQRLEIVEERNEYSLMVYDFGGGTTDITLMRVVNEYDEANDVYTIRPQVLGANGNNWFGGEDVTDMVVRIARGKAYDLLRKERYPNATNIVLPLDQQKFEKTQYRGFATSNRLALRAWAEASKIALAEFEDDHPGKVLDGIDRPDLDLQGIRVALQDGLKLIAIIDGAIKEERFRHNDVVPRMKELEDRLRPKLEELVAMMRELASVHGIHRPDIVLLSGKSSAFKLVSTVIQESFGDSTIAKPDDLKECVVEGACSYFSTEIRAGIEIDIADPLTTTTSRLGIRVNEAGKVKFKGFVEAGVPIPPAGLQGPIRGLGRLHRHNMIRILENTSSRDEFVVDGQENREIRELKSYRVDQTIKDWEEKHQTEISDKDLTQAQIKFEISPALNIRLLAWVPGIDTPIEFTADLD